MAHCDSRAGKQLPVPRTRRELLVAATRENEPWDLALVNDLDANWRRDDVHPWAMDLSCGSVERIWMYYYMKKF